LVTAITALISTQTTIATCTQIQNGLKASRVAPRVIRTAS
jgi:hypothetical protein